MSEAETGPSAPKRCNKTVREFSTVGDSGFLNLFKLSKKLDSELSAIKFAQEVGLIPTKGFCPSCHAEISNMRIKRCAGRPDIFNFSCCKRQCRGRNEVSIRKGTWFESTKIPLTKSILLTYCFANQYPHSLAVMESSLGEEKTSPETVTDMYSYCREVCAESLYDGCQAKQIGGANYVVEIDKAKFGKRKYKKGKLVEGQWVLGGICRETKECFLVPVADCTEATLLGLIEKYVARGSHIYTDCFESSSTLQDQGYVHLTENKSEHFVDPETGAHKKTIESTWWAVRRSLPSNSAHQKLLASHLSEYMWRKIVADYKSNNIFYKFVDAIKEVYLP